MLVGFGIPSEIVEHLEPEEFWGWAVAIGELKSGKTYNWDSGRYD